MTKEQNEPIEEYSGHGECKNCNFVCQLNSEGLCIDCYKEERTIGIDFTEKFESGFFQDKLGMLNYHRMRDYVITAIEKSYLAGKEDRTKEIVEMINTTRKSLDNWVSNPERKSDEYDVGYMRALLELKQSIIK
jgi:hypothetical protein